MARERYLIGVTQEELQPPPPPPEPKTLPEKLARFWLRHKWKVILPAIGLALALILVVQMLTRTSYEFTLVVVSKTAMGNTAVGELQRAMKQYSDGKDVQVLTLHPGKQDGMAQLSVYMNTGDEIFFAFDPDSYKEWMGEDSDFAPLNAEAFGLSADGRYWNWKGSSLYKSAKGEGGSPPTLYFGVRDLPGRNSKQTAHFEACKAMLESIITVEGFDPDAPTAPTEAE